MRIRYLQFIALLLAAAIPAAAQPITITPESLDFGEVSIGYPAALQFTLVNTEVDRHIAVTLSPSDTAHFRLGWTGARAEARRVMTVLGDIRDACTWYWMDRGEYPESVEELLELRYLEIPAVVSRNWTFEVIGTNPTSLIEAVSTAQMPDGRGHTIRLNLDYGEYYGYGVPLGDPEEPGRVQATIGAIYNAVKMYLQDFGEDPASVDELIEGYYLVIQPDLLSKWEFQLVGGNPIERIQAVSTNYFIDGAGKRVVFDIESGRFTGFLDYGGFHDWLWDDRSSLTLSLRFSPRDARDYASEVLVYLDEDGERNDTLSIPVHASGTLRVDDKRDAYPTRFVLYPAYPNPFNSAVTIQYAVPRPMRVSAEVFDSRGARVAVWDQGLQAAGIHSILWDADGLAGGIYLLRLNAGGQSKESNLILVK